MKVWEGFVKGYKHNTAQVQPERIATINLDVSLCNFNSHPFRRPVPNGHDAVQKSL